MNNQHMLLIIFFLAKTVGEGLTVNILIGKYVHEREIYTGESSGGEIYTGHAAVFSLRTKLICNYSDRKF